VPKVTTRSLYPEGIANLKLPIDTFYRESRSGVNIAKRITTGLFGLVSLMLNSLHLKRSEDCNLNLITAGKLNTGVNSYVPF
jgi:hypothetical protein